ncbi:MAG: ABC transporter ATP-binding protein [Eubacteriales bacterium]
MNAQPSPKKRFSKSSMLLFFLRGSKRFFVAAVLFSFTLTLLEMLIPQIVSFTIDSVIGNKAPSAAWIAVPAAWAGGVDFLRAHVWVLALAVAAVALLAAGAKYLNLYCHDKAAETLMCRMRDTLFAHVHTLPYEWHNRHDTGDIIQRCTSDVDTTRNFVAEQLLLVFRIVILMFLSFFFMFRILPKLTLVAALSIPVIFLYSVVFSFKMTKRFTACDESEGVLSTIAQENLTGVRVVRAFGRENDEREKFERQNSLYTTLWLKLCRLLTLFWTMGDLISGVQVMLVITLGAVLAVRGELSAGQYIAFVSYNAMMIWPVRQLGRVISEMSKAGVSIDRIRYIMNAPPETDAEDDLCPPMDGDIVFSHVSFAYDQGQEVLDDVSFTAKGGRVLGILGATGSGKSTLMHLLCRLYELPQDGGDITIGGVSVRRIRRGWLRSHIGMVLQEPFLFSRTIAENIAITSEGLSHEEIRAAAQTAALDEAVCGFPRGYDTVVGERGVTLSGGQKQRVAIARMLVQKAPIMVYDDALSAVDAETDAAIRREMTKHFGSATVVLIAHRMTTLMHADHIIVLDRGRIAEQGTHDELLARDGIYRQIYDIQMSAAEGGQNDA